MADAWSLDPEAWREFDRLAQDYGWETGIELIGNILTHPEEYEKPGDPRIAAMAESLRGWNDTLEALGFDPEGTKDILGYGILMMSGGINNIFIKVLMGRPEDIDKADVLTAMLELGGAYGYGNAAKAISKIPIIGSAFSKAGGGLDDLIKSIMKFGVTDDVGKFVDDALEEAIKKGTKEAIEETGEVGARQAGKIAVELGEEATQAGSKYAAGAAGKVGAEGAEAGAKVTQKTINTLSGEIGDYPTLVQAAQAGIINSADDVITFYSGTSVPQSYVDDIIKQAERHTGTYAEKIIAAAGEGQKAYSGILKNMLGRLRMTPVVGKLFTGLGAGGAVVGGYFVLDKIASSEAFGGFYIEERDQLTTFALMYTDGDYQGMAKIIAEQGLFMIEAGDLYYSAPHLAAKTIGKISGADITYQQAEAYHQETYRMYLQGHIDNLTKAGAWIKDGSNNGMGRPATDDEIANFLQSAEGKMYAKHYEDYYQGLKRTTEGQAKLYDLWKGGYIPDYLVGNELVFQFEQRFKSEKKELDTKTAGQLDPEQVISAVKSFLYESKNSAVWKNPEQVERAVKYGNLLNTLIQSGAITDINTKILLDSYQAKLIGITGQNIQWTTLSSAEMGTKIGAPETKFYSGGARNPVTIGFSESSAVTTTSTVQSAQGTQTITDETPEGVQPQRIGAMATGAAKVVGTGETGAGTARAEYGGALLTDAEYGWLNQIKAGKRTEEELQKLYPTVYESLKSKGLVGTKEAIIEGEAERRTAEPAKPSVSQEELIKTVNTLQQLGMSNRQISQAIEESIKSLGAEGYFKYPEGGYTPELLQAMLASPKGEERSIAMQMLEQLRKKAAPQPERGAYGYERTEVITAPPSEEEAYRETLQIAKSTPGVSEMALMEIYDYLKTQGTSPTKAITETKDLTEEAKEALFKQMGITEYKPTKEGYAPVFGLGRIKR